MFLENISNFTLYYIYANAIIYLIPLVFFYLYLSESILSLSDLSKLNKRNFLQKIAILLFILNLAGVPPLPGFFIKLNIFLLISKKVKLSIILLFVVLNFIIFFFYIRNYRKLTPNKTKLHVNNSVSYVLPLLVYLIGYPIIAPYMLINLLSIFI